MELLGKINEREIYYCNIRSESNWYDSIKFNMWIAFTVADNEDKYLLNDLTIRCLDKGICYSCNTGQLGSLLEEYFDEEIVNRQVQREISTGETHDYESTPMTSFHNNFNEGFWFAAVLARQVIDDRYVESLQVVCIDCTNQKVRKHLINLIGKINTGWLPLNNQSGYPVYDNMNS